MEQGRLTLSGPLLARVEARGREFLADFYAAELERKPGDLGALVELGNLYTQLGRHADGLAVDRQLVLRLPDDPTTRYNLACSLALTGAESEALAELERAIALGYDDAEHLVADEDLASLRGDPRFAELARALRERSA